MARVHAKPAFEAASIRIMTGIRPLREEPFVAAASSDSAPPSINCGGVPLQDIIRKRETISRTKTYGLFVFLCTLAILVGMRFPASLKGTDFPDFYCAGRMLAEGHGRQLYDAELQRSYQARYAGRVGTLYIHPPFEAVLYLGVAWLPLRPAYVLWWFFNFAVLAVALGRLAKQTLLPLDRRALLGACFTFVPCLLCFLQGQDSLLLLLLVVLAFTALRQGREFACGCWLGLGLFKPELVLPLALVLVLTQESSGRRAVAKGFGLVALSLAGVSAAISGWSVFRIYPQFLLHLQELPFAGIAPQAMANFRGLAHILIRRDGAAWAIATIAICSVAALLTTVKGWRRVCAASPVNLATNNRGEFDLAFANTVLFALLVSYHLNPHDLSLLLLPIFLLLRHSFTQTALLHATKRWMTVGLIAILFLPPLHVWTLRAGAYALVSLPMLSLFLTVGWGTRQIKVAPTL